MDLDDLYTQLSDYLQIVKDQFLQKYLSDPLAGPDDFGLPVKSFCILCHAAFEEFVETLSLSVMNDSIKKYKNSKTISAPLISLAHFKAKRDESFFTRDSENLSTDDLITIFDYNRKIFEEIKDSFSREVYNNHGVSLKYLRSLLMPVSIDVPKDVNWINSLQKLANERGAYAHKFLETGRVKSVLEPEEANSIVNDCLKLCEEIMNRAKSVQ